MTKKLLTFFAISLIFLLAVQAQAATNFSFSPFKINVKEGQTFRFNINVNPHGVMNYTVKASVKFPADLVALKTWTYAEDWMPVRKSGYDYFDNASGVMIRTAGYPEGFDKTTSFGSAVFMAKKSGTGVIAFASDSFSLDENNSNQYAGGDQLAMVISPLSQTNPPSEAPSSTPETINPPASEVVEQSPDTVKSALLNKSSDLIYTAALFALSVIYGNNVITVWILIILIFVVCFIIYKLIKSKKITNKSIK